jgi:cytochrome P450
MKPSDPVRPAPYGTPGEPFFDERGVLHLTRYADVTEITRRERRGQFTVAFSVVREGLEKYGITVPDPVHVAWLFPWAQGTVEADGSPGRHAVLHGVLAEYLGKQAVRDLRPTMVEIAGRLVRENVEHELAQGGTVGTIDLARFTDLLAFRSISALVGFPRTPAAEAFMMSHLEEYNSRADLIEGMRPEAPEVREYFQSIVDGHRGDGLLGRIIAAHGTGQITLDERDALMWGCWSAGRDTSATLTALLFGLVDEVGAVSTMVANLGDDGADWRAKAINEALRFTPFGTSFRTSVEDVVLDNGITVPEGTQLHLHWDATNRDPSVFGQDAGEFRPDRGVPRQNLSFGHGMHYCLGAPVALAEADIAAVAVYGALPGLTVTKWHRLARLTDVVATAEAEYDLPAAARALGLAA